MFEMDKEELVEIVEDVKNFEKNKNFQRSTLNQESRNLYHSWCR
jgi:hypothetical protein